MKPDLSKIKPPKREPGKKGKNPKSHPLPEEPCMVCRGPFEKGDHITVCPECDNPAHYGHLAEWLKTGKGCPICKYYFHLESQKPELPEFQASKLMPEPDDEWSDNWESTCTSIPVVTKVGVFTHSESRKVAAARTVVDEKMKASKEELEKVTIPLMVVDNKSESKDDLALQYKYNYT